MEVQVCPSCGATAPRDALVCVGCQRLFHAERLKLLVEAAGAYEGGGDVLNALTQLREALTLLPPDTKQAAAVRARVAQLEAQAPAAARGAGAPAWLAGFGAAGALLWKVGGPLLLVLSKGKLLLLGLFKVKTFASLFFSAAIYQQVAGGWVPIVVLGSIYVHEMGHVFAFQRYGIEVTAPMFVPGVGAFVRGSHYPQHASAQADVALSGPRWGAGVAAVALLLGWAFGLEVALASAAIVAEVNAFNLIPVWQLDGNRAIAVLSPRQRVVLGLVGLAVSVPVGLTLGVVAALGHLARAVVMPGDAPGEAGVLRSYIVVVVVLAALRGAAMALIGG